MTITLNRARMHPTLTMRIATATLAAAAATVGMAGHASAATTSDTVSQQISLDTSGTGTVVAFDPALGTLTQVDWQVSTNGRAQLCIENLSATAGSAVGGTMQAGVTVTFPGSETTVASINQTVPAVTLTASDGEADCDGYDPVTRTYPAPVSSPDVQYIEGVDPASNSATVTDPAALQAYVGPGTLPYSYTSFSDADVQQPSEWVIVFFADGAYSLTITYTYTPLSPTTTTTTTTLPGPTTTVPPGPTTTAPPAPTTTAPPAPTTAPPAPTTTDAGGSGGSSGTTVPGLLPRTGSDSDVVAVIALVVAAAGGALVLVGRRSTTR